MAIPGFQTFMLPVLRICSDGNEHRLRDIVPLISDEFGLSEEERSAPNSSGRQHIVVSRIAWAKTYLNKAGLLESTRWGYFRITEAGRRVLKSPPPHINIKFLLQFDEFAAFKNAQRDDASDSQVTIPESEPETPEELLDGAYQRLRLSLADDLLDAVKECSPQFFERLVVDLLVAMGYGGSRADAGKTTKPSGDGGVDGLIKEDRLGLDTIYIQAKRWRDGVVGRPEIQRFVGALVGLRAKKGVFITTSDFSREAWQYVETVDAKVVLIDGPILSKYMIDFDIGVSRAHVYEVKKIDTDFFLEE